MQTEIVERTRASPRPVLMNAPDPSTQCLRSRRGEVFPLKDRHLTAVLGSRSQRRHRVCDENDREQGEYPVRSLKYACTLLNAFSWNYDEGLIARTAIS